MNTLQLNYQAVIDDIAADMKALQQSGLPGDTVSLKMLQKRLEWLKRRRDKLNERRNHAISEFAIRLEAYLHQCENFWKERHGRTYEKKMDDVLEAKRRVVKIYSLTGFDACYALMLALKPLRSILPLPQYEEHAPALVVLEAIKEDCMTQLATYIKT